MEIVDIKADNRAEELLRYKTILESKEDKDVLSQILNRLEELEISYEDLSSTKIGKSLKKLTKNKEKSIALRANKLIEKWKKMVENKKNQKNKTEKVEKSPSEYNTDNSSNPNVEVKATNSNTQSEPIKKNFHSIHKKNLEKLNDSTHPTIRNSVRKTIYEALLNKQEPEDSKLVSICELAIHIEDTVHSCLFKQDDRGSKYLSRVKAIASNLQDKNNPDFRSLVISKSLTALEITQMEVKNMASFELQNKRQIAEKDSFNSMRSDWHEVYAPVGVGMYTCEKCKGQRTTSKELQLRGADEPMTLFLRCVDCGNEWRIG